MQSTDTRPPPDIKRPLPAPIRRQVNVAAHHLAMIDEGRHRADLEAKARTLIEAGAPVADVLAALQPPALPVLNAQPLALKTWRPTAGHHASP